MVPREWLKNKRVSAGLSQLEVAEKTNIGVSSVNKYELGIRTPQPRIAKRIAKILNFDWTIFYEDETEQKNNCPKKGS